MSEAAAPSQPPATQPDATPAAPTAHDPSPPPAVIPTVPAAEPSVALAEVQPGADADTTAHHLSAAEPATPPAFPTPTSPGRAAAQPPTSPGRSRLNGCGYVDAATAANLGDALLFAACHAAVLDTHGRPFASDKDAVPALCAALLAQLAAPPAAGEAGGPQPTLRDLHTRLTAFVEARRSWLTRPPLASEAALQERASALRGALQAAGAPCAVDADAAAPRLVAAWDAVGTAHCVEAVAPCHLAEHKTGCPFRPVRCPHEGCLAHAAASALARHDAACGFKPVPCAQGCGAMVPRNQMAAHCGGGCDSKPCSCPFAHLGCVAALTAGARDAHTRDEVAAHVALIAAALTSLAGDCAARGQQIDGLSASLGKGGPVAAAVAGAAAAAVAAEARAAAAERAAAAAEREAAAARREAREARDDAKAARADGRRVAEEALAMRKQLTALMPGGGR